MQTSQDIIDTIAITLSEISLTDIEISEDTELLGGNALLDSVSFISFIVKLEEKLNKTSSLELCLTDDIDAFDIDGPFKNVQSLLARIQQKLTPVTEA